MALDTYQKAAKLQNAAEKLVSSYGQESTLTDAFRAACNFRRELHSLSNASLARLYDIMEEMK